MNQDFISATYTWGQFAPEFALVALAAIILLADCFIPQLPKRAYSIVAAVGALIAAFYMTTPEHSSAFGLIACLATALVLLLNFDYHKVSCESIGGSRKAPASSILCCSLPAPASAVWHKPATSSCSS